MFIFEFVIEIEFGSVVFVEGVLLVEEVVYELIIILVVENLVVEVGE